MSDFYFKIHLSYIGSIGGGNNFCLQKSRMPTDRIGIFNVIVEQTAITCHICFEIVDELCSVLLSRDVPRAAW